MMKLINTKRIVLKNRWGVTSCQFGSSTEPKLSGIYA